MLRGHRVIGVDVGPERLERARANGVDIIDGSEDNIGDLIRDATDGRGPESVIDAVGMEAHGSPAAYEMFQKKQDGAVKVVFTP